MESSYMIIDGVVIEFVEGVNLQGVSEWILDCIRALYEYNEIIDYHEYRQKVDKVIESGMFWLKKRKNMYRILSNIGDRMRLKYSYEEFNEKVVIYLAGCFLKEGRVEIPIVQYISLRD